MIDFSLKSMLAFLFLFSGMLFLEKAATAQGWEPLQRPPDEQGRFTTSQDPKSSLLKSSWVERFRGTLLLTNTSPRPNSPADSLGSTCQKLNICFRDIGLFVSIITSFPLHLVFLIGNIVAFYSKSPLFKKGWGIAGTIVSIAALTWGFIWFGADLGTKCGGGISPGAIVGHVGLGVLGLVTLGMSIFNIVMGVRLDNPKTIPISLIPTFSSSATEGTRVGMAWVGTF